MRNNYVLERKDEKIFKFFLIVNQVVTKKLRKKLQKNLVDWKSRCNFAGC